MPTGTPGVDPDRQIRCPWCEVVAVNLNGLRSHARVHDVDEQDLWHFMFGSPRTCLCGCGKVTSFCTVTTGYLDFSKGHGKRLNREVREEPTDTVGSRYQTEEMINSGVPVGMISTAKVNDVSLFRCRYCTYSTRQPKRFADHLSTDHNLDPEQEFVHVNFGGVAPVCKCGCGGTLTWYGWSKGYTSEYLKGHNYSDMHTSESQRKATEGRLRFYSRGGTTWNDGLTKETDERIAESSMKTGLTLRDGYKSGRLLSLSKRNPEKWGKITQSRSLALRLSPEEVLKRVEVHSDKFELMSDVSVDYKSFQRSLLKFRCRTCDSVFEKTLVNFEGCPRCFKCHPQASYDQVKVYDFVKSLLPETEEVILSDRTLLPGHRELDIYIPSRKFAIEYNGLGFHNEDYIGNDYHWAKTRDCAERGIQLLHIFSDEWKPSNKRSVVESMIRQRLGVTPKFFDARKKMTVRTVKNKVREEFFESNHIDGDVRAIETLGLFTPEGELVMALSLRVPRGEKYSHCLELARVATVKNVRVRGGLGKLVSRAKDVSKQMGKTHLLSYVDLRYGTGTSYEEVGFVEDHLTPPRFWWVGSDCLRIDRFAIRADPKRGMSEKEVAAEGGHRKVFGCPSRVMIKKL